MKPQITVGICVKNSQSTIGDTIKSIVAQDYRHDLMEIIIVDGDSKDATLSIVRDLLSQSDMQWRIQSDGGKGLGYARQSILNQAQASYLIFIDADTVIRSDFFRMQVEFMDIHPRVAVGLGRQMHKAGKGESWLATAWNLSRSIEASDPRGGGRSVAICRTDAFRSVGGFDEKIKGAGEDLDIIARLQSNGWSREINEKAEYFHEPQLTLKSLWSHQNWFGYGEYYLSRKYRGMFHPWRNLPPAELIHGIKVARRVYRSTRRKISFLILPILIFKSTAWWVGFVQGAFRYGRPD